MSPRRQAPPFYCYSTATIERHYRLFAEAVGAPARHVFYAMKANSNLGVLRTLANLGAGATPYRKARSAKP